MRQKIVNGKHRVTCSAADGNLDCFTIFQSNHTMQFQRNGNPLIFADSAVIVCLQKCHFFRLIQRILLQIQSRRINVRCTNINTVFQSLAANYRQHNSLAAVNTIYLITRFKLHATLKGHIAVGLSQTNSIVHTLTLGLAGIQILFVILAVGLHCSLFSISQTIPTVLLLVGQRFPTKLSHSLFFTHDNSSCLFITF